MRQKITIQDYHNLEKEKGITFLNIETSLPMRACYKTECICNDCNYVWRTSYIKLRSQKKGCKRCMKNLKITEELFLSRCAQTVFTPIQILENGIFPKNCHEKTIVKCNVCGHEKTTNYLKLLKNGCPKCNKCLKKTADDYIVLSKKKNITFLELETNFPKNVKTNTLCRCNKCNYIWNSSFDKLNQSVFGCQSCSRNIGERICREFLKSLYGHEFEKTKPEWLINPETGFRLELDGYCQALNLAFEYNGNQHYELMKLFKVDEKRLKITRKTDSLKIKICKERGIKLIIINQFTRNNTMYATRSIKEAFDKADILLTKENLQLLKDLTCQRE